MNDARTGDAMKRRFLFLMTLTLAVLPGCSRIGVRNPREAIAAARGVDERFVDAFNRRDAGAVSTLYWKSDETVLFAPDTQGIQGWDAIQKYYVEMLPRTAVQLDLLHVDYKRAGEKIISVGTCNARQSWTPFANIPFSGNQVRFTRIFGLHDRQWFCEVDHVSMSPRQDGEPSWIGSGWISR
jgi:ketosteroid isomerase-like protein